MKRLNKILVISVAIALTVLMMACGEEDQTEQMASSPQPNQYGYNQGYGQQNYGQYGNGFNYEQLAYGYTGFPCNNANGRNINIDYYQQYPSLGHFLQGNPQAVVQFGNNCFNGSDLYGMYNRYYQGQGYQNAPWELFYQSPYASAQIYGYNPNGSQQSRGRYSYSNSTNVNSEWVGLDDFYGGYFGGGSYPGYKPRDQWRFRFRYWND